MNRVNRECFILPPVCSFRTSRDGDEGFLLKQLSVLFFWLPFIFEILTLRN